MGSRLWRLSTFLGYSIWRTQRNNEICFPLKVAPRDTCILLLSLHVEKGSMSQCLSESAALKENKHTTSELPPVIFLKWKPKIKNHSYVRPPTSSTVPSMPGEKMQNFKTYKAGPLWSRAPLYTHLSHPSCAFLPVKPNSCFQALNPCSALLHVALTAWNRLPCPPPPPWGPLGKLLLPFKSLIWNFCYHGLGPTIPVCMVLSSFQGFGVWVLKPGKIQAPGTSWSPTQPLTDRINLSL